MPEEAKSHPDSCAHLPVVRRPPKDPRPCNTRADALRNSHMGMWQIVGGSMVWSGTLELCVYEVNPGVRRIVFLQEAYC